MTSDNQKNTRTEIEESRSLFNNSEVIDDRKSNGDKAAIVGCTSQISLDAFRIAKYIIYKKSKDYFCLYKNSSGKGSISPKIPLKCHPSYKEKKKKKKRGLRHPRLYRGCGACECVYNKSTVLIHSPTIK